MFCKNCGSPLDDNASFCGNCGAKVNQEKAQAEPSSNKKKHSPLKFVFLILALLLVCGEMCIRDSYTASLFHLTHNYILTLTSVPNGF